MDHPALPQVPQVGLHHLVRVQPVLDEADDRVGRQRVLAAVVRAPRLGGVGVGERVAEDDDEVRVREELLQQPHTQHARRRLLEHEGLLRAPVRTPLGVELACALGGGELARLGEVGERVEGEETRAAERVVRREDALHVLALILQLRRHALDRVARDFRVRLEELSEDGRAAAVQADDEHVARVGGGRGAPLHASFRLFGAGRGASTAGTARGIGTADTAVPGGFDRRVKARPAGNQRCVRPR